MKSCMLDCVLVTAIEGGSNYWCASILALPPRGARIDIGKQYGGDEGLSSYLHKLPATVTTHEDGVAGTLTVAKLRTGIRMDAKVRGVAVARWFDEHDADYADNALQYAVFGKLVYG